MEDRATGAPGRYRRAAGLKLATSETDEKRKESTGIPDLVRRQPLTRNQPSPADLEAVRQISPRERRLYITLAVVLGVNLLVIFGLLTFFALALHK